MGWQRKIWYVAKKRVHTISTRLNDEELEKLKRMKGKMSYGAYIRNMIFSRMPAIIPKVNREAYSETARWASVLNQIARRLNMTEDVKMQEVIILLDNFRQSLINIDFQKADINDCED